MIIGYVDTDRDLGNWVDGPADERTRDDLLEAAFDKVNAWAPDTTPPAYDKAPARYRQAQLLLVRHLWARKQAGDGEGSFGPDGYMVSTYPLVREAFDLIRPRRSPLEGLL